METEVTLSSHRYILYFLRIVKRVGSKRPRGRPRTTWKEGLQEVTRKKGVTWKEVERTVKDRQK
jgi:hypothetical protein